jgi:spore coat polysaccharide biosynthesis protein SpsF (cytidylyltransferase family)/aryl-alcohol dehydrogenase-like predicted oxidoreductase
LKVLVVIQARMGSSRLPGKALLPLAGLPSAVLCARRAASRGHEVVVAIPENESDDVLAEVLATAGLKFIRGPSEDILKRFVQATAELPPEALVVRLTADNVFPNGEFLEGLIQEFLKRGIQYFATRSPLDGLPYGMSAEVFLVESLRRADREATAMHDREHVTPWIRRNASVQYASPSLWIDEPLAHLRSTIDNLDDYVRLARVFSGVQNPVEIRWQELSRRLGAFSEAPLNRVPYKLVGDEVHSTMTLGTAQIGMAYGVANVAGMPSQQSAERIIKRAIGFGITSVDCARAYGYAERRLGNVLRQGFSGQISVITKLSPLDSFRTEGSENALRAAVDASVFRSCLELSQSRLNTLLLHRWEHRTSHGGAIWNRLLELRNEGVIDKLGVSVYTPDAAIEAIEDPEIEHIQLPFNLLDWRWRRSTFWERADKRPSVIVHVRSALLQGLLLAPPEKWPKIPGVDPMVIGRRLDYLCRKLGREGRLDLSLAYVRGHERVTSVVLGVDTESQLSESVQLFQRPALSVAECDVVDEYVGQVKAALLDPSQWNRAA